MGNRYTQITIEERCELARLQAAGNSIRQIAASLDRAPSTIARELKRNSSLTTGYKPSYAHERARSHRGSDHASTAIAACVTGCCPGLHKVGRQNRSLAGSPMSMGNR